MKEVQQRQESYRGVQPFRLSVSHVQTDRNTPNEGEDSHVHPECEIYVNRSGDVSFMVEHRIYPITSGSIVITRPYEYHHCVYHSDAPHEHFWILFSCEGNEALLGKFFQRKAGEDNLLLLPTALREELISLCADMASSPATEAEQQYRFFHLLHLLEQADPSVSVGEGYPADVALVLDHINRHFSEPLVIGALAKQAHVSINTLERHFAAAVHLSPTAYLRKKRLAYAAELLYRGETVMNACMKSGFSDYSNFIALFKRTYGVTPLRYQRQVSPKL